MLNPAAAAGNLFGFGVFNADRGDDRRVGGGGLVGRRGIDGRGEAAEAGSEKGPGAEAGKGKVVVEEGSGGRRGGRHFWLVGFWEHGTVAVSSRGLREMTAWGG